uniref:U3 small nucleolar RNA-associated protein 4 homolog n=1 Tax=Styela clava TaxID=7725 RepID=UPI0019397BF7|nr:U3 small nucleolar RNA-associated protein 4 homolog [Styela clava]
MGEFAVHRCQLFEYTPCTIQCIASYESSEGTASQKLLAVGRENGAIDLIRCTKTGFYKYMGIPASSTRHLEDIAWYNGRLFSAELQGIISEYDLVKGTIKRTEDSYGGAVWCLAVGNKKGVIAAGCEDGSLKIYNCEKNSLSFEKSFDKQEGRILSCAFHPDNDVLVSGSVGVIRIWSYKSGHAMQRINLESSRSKNTIVWAVKILSNNTIVSGDSTGKVNFWNGKNTTLLKSFQNHRADVLSLCVSHDEKVVYASGVDSRVLAINCSSAMVGEDDPSSATTVDSWVLGATLQKHTHDVRALAIVGNYLVSGGVDTNILLCNIKKGDFTKIKRMVDFPHKSVVHIAENPRLVLFQYPKHLDIWRIATPRRVNGEAGEKIDLEQDPAIVLQIKMPASQFDDITCSAISKCGHWVAYSSQSSFRLFRLQWEKETPSEISLNKIPIMWIKSALAIAFTPASEYLITSASNGKIFVIKLEPDGHVHVAHVFKNETDSILNVPAVLFSATNELFAAVDLNDNIKIYDLEKPEIRCTLPSQDSSPTAISFKPSSTKLIVAYQNHAVIEYDADMKSYTKWSREANSVSLNLIEFPCKYTKRPKKLGKWNTSPIINISFNADDPNIILLSSQKALYFLNTSSDILKKIISHEKQRSENAVEQSKEYAAELRNRRKMLENPVKSCDKFEQLLHASFIDGGSSIFVLERPWHDIFDNLPPTLYQKKFGT